LTLFPEFALEEALAYASKLRAGSEEASVAQLYTEWTRSRVNEVSNCDPKRQLALRRMVEVKEGLGLCEGYKALFLRNHAEGTLL
jgi:hypothetical protein